jgi:hypothetical protein
LAEEVLSEIVNDPAAYSAARKVDEYGNSMIDQIREKVGGYDDEAPEAAGQAIEMSHPRLPGQSCKDLHFHVR